MSRSILTRSKLPQASETAPAKLKVQNQPKTKYRLAFEKHALKEWHALDGSVKAIFKKQLAALLHNPHVPSAALRGELHGCYKIKLRQQGYRLVYKVVDKLLLVLVLAVDKRDGEEAYKSAMGRIVDGKGSGKN